MARTLGSVLGVCKQTEMLAMTVMTLWANVFDMTLFELGSNLEQVWNVPLEITKFSAETQNVIKILLSGVVFVRTFSLHLYIAFLIAMMWPATFGSHPTLMLPWLTVSAVKNIGAGVVTFATGLYTCLIYGPLRPACLRFFTSQVVALSPSFYMWIVGISLYRDLRKPLPVDKAVLRLTEEEELNMALRRRKVKSMVDEDILRKQFESRRKFVGTSAVEVKEIFTPASFEQSVFSARISRSLDSLLDAMTAEAEILDAEELEPVDDWLDVPHKTAKLLGITMSDISRIKQNRQTSQDLPLYPVTAQKKQTNISNAILTHESPLKLLTETSLYTPSVKPVRPTKSELKSPKDFLKLKSPSDFMQSVPESELRLSNYTSIQEQTTATNCATETVFHTNQAELNDQNNNTSEDQQLTEETESETQPEIKIISKKISHEIGCQVSTLSKRILNASAKDISDKLNIKTPKLKTTPSKSRTIPIRPPTSDCHTKPQTSNGQNRVSNHNLCGSRSKSRSFLNKNSSSVSPRGVNSYLSMHLQKMELTKTIENSKFGVDKFGLVSSNPSSDHQGKGLLFGEYDLNEKLENTISRKTFENITFKF